MKTTNTNHTAWAGARGALEARLSPLHFSVQAMGSKAKQGHDNQVQPQSKQAAEEELGLSVKASAVPGGDPGQPGWKVGRGVILGGDGCSLVAELCLTLRPPMDCSPPGSSGHGFSRQEYWSGLPFPSPGHLLDPGIEPRSPALAGRFFTTVPPGKRHSR